MMSVAAGVRSPPTAIERLARTQRQAIGNAGVRIFGAAVGTVRETFGGTPAGTPFRTTKRSLAYLGEDGGRDLRSPRRCDSRSHWGTGMYDPHGAAVGLTGPRATTGEDVKSDNYLTRRDRLVLESGYTYRAANTLLAAGRENRRAQGRAELSRETGACENDTTQAQRSTPRRARRRSDSNHTRTSTKRRSELLSHALVSQFVSWGRHSEGYGERPRLRAVVDSAVRVEHVALPKMLFALVQRRVKSAFVH